MLALLVVFPAKHTSVDETYFVFQVNLFIFVILNLVAFMLFPVTHCIIWRLYIASAINI